MITARQSTELKNIDELVELADLYISSRPANCKGTQCPNMGTPLAIIHIQLYLRFERQNTVPEQKLLH